MIYTLVDKAILLSNSKFHNDNLELIRKFLTNNNYPVNFINFYIKKRLDSIKYKLQDSENHFRDIHNEIIAKKPKVGVPYVEGYFHGIQKVLSENDIIAIPIIANNLSNIVVKGKYKLKKENRTNVVYSFEEHQAFTNWAMLTYNFSRKSSKNTNYKKTVDLAHSGNKFNIM